MASKENFGFLPKTHLKILIGSSLFLLLVFFGRELLLNYNNGQVLGVFKMAAVGTPDYYVDATSGNDANDGRSSGSAWKTLNKVNSTTFSASDVVAFKRGEVFRPYNVSNSSGALIPQSGVDYTAYSTGDKPIISAAYNLTDSSRFAWEPTGSTNEYRLVAIGGNSPGIIQTDGVWMNGEYLLNVEYSNTPGSLADHEWAWLGDTIYLRDNSGDPNVTGVLIEAAQKHSAVFIENQSNIELNDLHFKHANRFLHITPQYRGTFTIRSSNNITVSNSIVEESSEYAVLYCYQSNNFTITNSIIRNMNRINHNNYMSTLERVVFNFSEGCTDSRIAHNIIHNNPHGSDVLQLRNGSDRNIVEYNEIYGPGANGIYNRNSSNNIIRYNYIHDMKSPLTYYGGGIGIQIRDNAFDNKIYSNVLINNLGPVLQSDSGTGGQPAGRNKIYNNFLYNGSTTNAGITLFGGSGIANAGTEVINNIVIGIGGSLLSVTSNTDNSAVIDNNCIYRMDGSDGVNDPGNVVVNTINGDPLIFQSSPTKPEHTRLQTSSPCRGQGVDLGDEYRFGVDSGSTWPDNVILSDHRADGSWDIGAMVYEPESCNSASNCNYFGSCASDIRCVNSVCMANQNPSNCTERVGCDVSCDDNYDCSYTDCPLQHEDNLVVHLNMDDGFIDISGYGNHGTAIGSSSAISGMIDGAYYFDNTEYAEISSNSSFNFGSNSFTISTWIKVDAWDGSTSQGYGGIVYYGNPFGAGYGLRRASTNHQIQFCAGSSSSSCVNQWTGQGISTGQWHHIVGVRDVVSSNSETFYLYVDGEEALTLDRLPENITPGQILTIAKAGTGNRYLTSSIDDVRIYNIALDPQDVEDLYLWRGGESIITSEPSVCTENWSCTGWNVCSSLNTQTRACSDLNSCGTTTNRSSERQSCTYTPPNDTPPEGEDTTSPPVSPPPVITPMDFISSGSLIKKQGSAAVYYLGADNKLHTFPSQDIYHSWYTDFSNLKIVSDADFKTYSFGQNVFVRPGAKLIQAVDGETPWNVVSGKVYAISGNGVLRHINTAQIAHEIFGADWGSLIVPIVISEFGQYTIGSPIDSTADYNKSAELINASSINMVKGLGN